MVNGMNSNGASAVPSCHGDEAIEWNIANQIMHHPASAPGDVSFSYLMWDSMCAEFHGIVPEHSTRPGRSILIRKCHLHNAVSLCLRGLHRAGARVSSSLLPQVLPHSA